MFFKKKRKSDAELFPDEVLMDSKFLSGNGSTTGEERLEMPLASRSILVLGAVFIAVIVFLVIQVWFMQIVEGESYTAQSEGNRLSYTPIFAERGVIQDRNEELLAWNVYAEDNRQGPFIREYGPFDGIAHLVGYTTPPLKDSSGFYYEESHSGVDGVEKSFNEELTGLNGLLFSERNVHGEVISTSVVDRPRAGSSLHLSVDVEVQELLYSVLKEASEEVGFHGAVGVLMDVDTGEVIAMTSYPEYELDALSSRDSERIDPFLQSERNPFLNRALEGVYTPGSIIKPFVAAGVLEEGIITPEEELISTATISIPNPYDPTRPTVFRDWRAHGRVNMERALALSSNVYFYITGGGFEGRKGLGIDGIEQYVRMFGFGGETGVSLSGEKTGTIPTPEWKAEHFSDGLWRVGDTYNTAIGQYGFQVTPLQVTRAVAAIANGGTLYTPSLIADAEPVVDREIDVSPENLEVIRSGMRRAVTEGTAQGLSYPDLRIAAKTGTAQVGSSNQYHHAWAVGFYPYEDPKYAFTILMDRGPTDDLRGGIYSARQFFDGLRAEASEYVTFDD